MNEITSYLRAAIIVIVGIVPLKELVAQTPCTTTVQCAQDAVTAAAQAGADVKALSDRLSKAEAAIAALNARQGVTVSAGGSKDSSGAWGGASQVDAAASCPPGQVVIGISIVLGGTCHTQCEGDGRPISRYVLRCGIPSVAK